MLNFPITIIIPKFINLVVLIFILANLIILNPYRSILLNGKIHMKLKFLNLQIQYQVPKFINQLIQILIVILTISIIQISQSYCSLPYFY